MAQGRQGFGFLDEILNHPFIVVAMGPCANRDDPVAAQTKIAGVTFFDHDLAVQPVFREVGQPKAATTQLACDGVGVVEKRRTDRKKVIFGLCACSHGHGMSCSFICELFVDGLHQFKDAGPFGRGGLSTCDDVVNEGDFLPSRDFGIKAELGPFGVVAGCIA